mmetsp:Transcript_21495/g.50031  ORF Transcript_21495/g.50031 Transcript_21495/m.50031 type:complete len:521 (+) Transcript_21495:56-1618(+)|eukprot:CAMPEP_0171110244 /NCGR_PEP_ID=MMETSP0766_2-20121228/71236_1 /TAXON_ID=439317 /ORGANISM="Gambierdiscus australes, Strain CAWD 149" /LENGTH=520 /DNA_ID=CAMNT_0011572087 /DNA_START=51 /DNA_END=1613 /DNA_ORIENTATION=-
MICGKDLDEVFAYQTPKIVVLKDRKLGFIALTLKLLIFVYIFAYVVMFQGKHLSMADVEGIYTISVRNPTADMCNPFRLGCKANYTSLVNLPYCRESPEPYGNDHTKRECQIWDSVEATLPAEDGMLLPTRIRRYDQVRSCEPKRENGWTCSTSPYEYLGSDGRVEEASSDVHDDKVMPKYDTFITDIEHFIVHIDHGFRRKGGLQADDISMNGKYYSCPDPSMLSRNCDLKQIPCVHNACPAGALQPRANGGSLLARPKHGLRYGASTVAFDNRGLASQEVAPNKLANELLSATGHKAVSLHKGDVFTLESLLQLANVNLDDNGEEMGDTLRASGLVLVIHIEYSNCPAGAFLGFMVTPWRTPPPFYKYRMSTRKAQEYKQIRTFDDPASRTRSIRIYNGVRVVIEQTGIIALWDTAHFLVTMTTALGLMAVANTLTDLMMTYLLPRSVEYTKRKYVTSKDFCPEDEAGGPVPDGSRPTTKLEAAEKLIDALESQDASAVAEALPDLVALCDKSQKADG